MDWSFLDVFWAMCIFFVWVLWFWLLITVFADLFRRHDLGGGMKALWIVFVVVVPYLGVFVYLISQGHSMTERRQAEARASQSDMDAYVRSVATTGGPTAEIGRAKELLDSGAITQTEFDAIKARALAAG